MPIQPYFPEPITVAGNIAEAKHRVRVRFVRSVVAWHFVSAVITGSFAFLTPFAFGWGVSLLGALGGLVALTMVRRAFPEGRTDSIASLVLLLPTLGFLGQAFHGLQSAGWPVIALAPASVSVALYTLFCGNDFSYGGLFSLSVPATWCALAVGRGLGYLTSVEVLSGGVLALFYLFYFSYDLSMLVKRRRGSEVPAAVADLYRDLLNFATYLIRVYLHWRKFRFI